MQYHQITLVLAATSALAFGQDSGRRPTFGDVTQDAGARLEASLAELTALRESIAAEKVPMAEELTRLELELSEARKANQAASRLLDTRTLGIEVHARGADALLEQFLAGSIERGLGA